MQPEILRCLLRSREVYVPYISSSDVKAVLERDSSALGYIE